jgi:transposase
LKQQEGYFNGAILVQDNAPCHSTLNVRNWMQDHNISELCITPLSPDLKPIENVWRIVKCRIRGKHFKNIDELWGELQQQWNEIPLPYLRTLFASLPRRVRFILHNNGGASHY